MVLLTSSITRVALAAPIVSGGTGPPPSLKSMPRKLLFNVTLGNQRFSRVSRAGRPRGRRARLAARRDLAFDSFVRDSLFHQRLSTSNSFRISLSRLKSRRHQFRIGAPTTPQYAAGGF